MPTVPRRHHDIPANRYAAMPVEKARGATYTPRPLADFVASQMLRGFTAPRDRPLRILDPAVGPGELLARLLAKLRTCRVDVALQVWGFDEDPRALDAAAGRLRAEFPQVTLQLVHGDLLSLITDNPRASLSPRSFDLIIANPPYVRTQILGSAAARALASRFHLSGRVDLSHAFVLAITELLHPRGSAGVILSNRFMTTKAGASVRHTLRDQVRLEHVWDLGDTKLFDASILPAVVVARGGEHADVDGPRCTSVYQTTEPADRNARSVLDDLSRAGVIAVPDGRRYRVRTGALDVDGGVWRVATRDGDAWLSRVERRTWKTFGEVGRIRVGVKTCADAVFIRDDWRSLPESDRPELLRRLTTHHIARRFRADLDASQRQILYPHEVVDGQRRAVDLERFPRSARYLDTHRARLERRSYLIDAGREWYELWVPQDAAAWAQPKLVFRDIAAAPCFWIDLDHTIVNGDCYWMTTAPEHDADLLWMAAGVANSTFCSAFYDLRFNNRLYAGRRRYITQYVDAFPLPNPHCDAAREIVRLARALYDVAGTSAATALESRVDDAVWDAFGVQPLQSSSRPTEPPS